MGVNHVPNNLEWKNCQVALDTRLVFYGSDRCSPFLRVEDILETTQLTLALCAMQSPIEMQMQL